MFEVKTKILLYLFFVFFITNTAFSQNKMDNVCPPFFLLDEAGQVIDPVNGINADKPYSPKKTCGNCHDYDKITRGFHFMQGKGEAPNFLVDARSNWVTSPGNYGGPWCSPAPLYNYLSQKNNKNADLMDLTSFTFVTAGCGSCHPGGGSLETDRDGYRYDSFMIENGMESGGINNYDGDYYKAKWDKSGVIEADCFICHLPEYNNKARIEQINKLNFKWAAGAGAGITKITGSVLDGNPVIVNYNIDKFLTDGRIAFNTVREPRNESCLLCHAKPGWKKRGTNFSNRTDVHLRAGLKCIDCHQAGSFASDERINQYELHEIGKGDDPAGHVKDELDNTVKSCTDCHITGYLGAPAAKHTWLPSLHLDRISCQTCHIPERAIKSVLLQASDVYNPGNRIPSKGKHLWTFYGPDMKYWNHYGDLEMMGFNDKPTNAYKPTLIKYKDKIYPVNRVHSAWPGIQIDGQKDLMQPRMADVYKMWDSFYKDKSVYPLLSEIVDDNMDGIIEINKPQEIDALINSVSKMLVDIKYPMENKKVVWVFNDRVYTSGMDFTLIEKDNWEASPFGNVHKYSHDIYPARAALGVNGCSDCHSKKSDFFTAQVLQYPFDDEGNPVFLPQYKLLGLSGFVTFLSIWRESLLKPMHYAGLVVLFLIGVYYLMQFAVKQIFITVSNRVKSLLILLTITIALFILYASFNENLAAMLLPSRFWLDSHHFLVSVFIILCAIYAVILSNYMILKVSYKNGQQVNKFWFITFTLQIISGLFMIFYPPSLIAIQRFSYTIFDLMLIIMLVGSIAVFFKYSNLHKIVEVNS